MELSSPTVTYMIDSTNLDYDSSVDVLEDILQYLQGIYEISYNAFVLLVIINILYIIYFIINEFFIYYKGGLFICLLSLQV